MRLLLALALTVAACGPEPSAHSPEEAMSAYRDALLDGDADRALALLEEAAEGSLSAMAELADARQRGYLQTPWDAERKAAGNLPISSNRWAEGRDARRFERAIRDSAQIGHEPALFLLADRLLAQKFSDGAWSTPRADRDSAEAIYRRLVAAEADPFRLAFLSNRLGLQDRFVAYLTEAADAGHPQACVILFWETSGRPGFSAVAVADAIDHHEGCRSLADEDAQMFAYGARAVGALTEQAALGNADAVATLDSLRALGVFERHPRLAPDA